MALAAGTRIAHFEVIAAIGAGGMGEVYRARDLDLGRDVALKVLPDHLAHDAARLIRFDREARAAAALNHPNILVVYEVGAKEPVPFVACELLSGQTLATTMLRPLGIRRALDYAAQAARGLAAAHDKGIVHRDIKPANLFVTTGGVLKILDFGIARFGDDDQQTQATMTAPGTVLGTTGYMAPEQVRGERVDARTDIFALGAVCYEMLTGRRAFPGDTAAESLAAILREHPPDAATVAADVPPAVARLVHRCLHKDAGERFQSARDLAFALESAADAGPGHPPSGRSAIGRRLPTAALAATVAAAALFGIQSLGRPSSSAPPSPRRLVLDLPASAPLSPDIYVPFALAPDGATLAFVTDQPERLFLRRLDDFGVREVPGTDGAYDPFFSPDGQWVGFWSRGEIKKVPVAGGPAVVVCQALDMLGASWGEDGTIVFSTGLGQGLSVVSADGGTPQPLTTLDTERGEVLHSFPQVLAGGRGVIFTAQSTSKDAPYAVELYDPGTKERRTLASGARYGRLLPSGHLVYVRQRALVGVRVSAQSVAPIGAAVPLVDEVHVGTAGAALFSVAADGTLAYVAHQTPPTSRLVWVDRAGAASDAGLPAGAYSTPRLSPDGRTVAVRVNAPPSRDIWVASFDRGTLERLTLGRTLENTFSSHSFSPDGTTLSYAEDAPGGAQVVVRGLDGSEPQTLLTWPRRISPAKVTGDGTLLVELGATTGGDLLLLPPGATQPRPLVQEAGNQWGNAVSPDGRAIAYAGDESGRFELYLRPFPRPGPKRQLTSSGGSEAVWSRTGRELFYRAGGRIMALPVTSAGLVAGPPRALFEDHFAPGSPGEPGYDVAPDGRFLMLRGEAAAAPRQVRVVLNWLEELTRLVP